MADEKQSFKPLRIKSIEFRNRLWVSPMCQYSSKDGHPNDWHFVHLGSRAVGGAGLVMIEATAVSPEGRISPDDSGFWLDEHTPEFKRIATFVKAQGAAIGIQLAHAGRKGSTSAPWFGGKFLSPDEGGWTPLAPSEIPFDKSSPPSHAMTQGDMAKVIKDFEKATDRVIKAGFQVLELHFAHGYLIHEFLSPLSIKGETSLAAASKIACDFHSNSRVRYGPAGRKTSRSS
jgi:2,4-dienoyl-CoA reductase-like NADH-dependent reductase (Old Yellow Enzyme family)